MYAEIVQKTLLMIPPEELGPNFEEHVKLELRRRYEGRLIEGTFYICVDQKSINILDRPEIQGE